MRAAGDYAKQFGFNGYAVREVNVGTAEPADRAADDARTQVAGAAADEAMPVEAGKATVTRHVNGSVQMTR